MKNPFSGLFRARDKPQDSVSAAPVFYFGTSGSGKSVTVQSAIQLSTVYACVRVIHRRRVQLRSPARSGGTDLPTDRRHFCFHESEGLPAHAGMPVRYTQGRNGPG